MKILATFVIGVLLSQASPAAAAVPPAPFPDMDGSWYLYREAVAVLKDRGVITGNPDGGFAPEKTINRAEFLKLVFAAKGTDNAATGGDCFIDVPGDAWFAPFVCTAERRGIAKGYPDGTFKPDQEVNWAEAIALISRAYGWDVEERTGERWYEPFAETLDRRDVLRASSYVPWQPLARERAADLVYRMLQYERGVTFESSPGCKTGDDVPTTVSVNGRERTFLVTIPDAAKRGTASPLLIAFHGRTNSNAQVRSYMGFDRSAKGYVIAYPSALKNGGSYSWADDLPFFDALVEHLAARLCIDMDRIYVAGHSLGGWMANTVACKRGGVVRASGSVGGDGISTECTGPSAAFIAHNPKDTTPPFSTAEHLRQRRIETNACSWDVETSEPRSLLCVRHEGCAGGNDVLWCPHEIDTDHRGVFYPHVWPREAGLAIVEFFWSLEGS